MSQKYRIFTQEGKRFHVVAKGKKLFLLVGRAEWPITKIGRKVSMDGEFEASDLAHGAEIVGAKHPKRVSMVAITGQIDHIQKVSSFIDDIKCSARYHLVFKGGNFIEVIKKHHVIGADEWYVVDTMASEPKLLPIIRAENGKGVVVYSHGTKGQDKLVLSQDMLVWYGDKHLFKSPKISVVMKVDSFEEAEESLTIKKAA
jgi:hypothetical protein